MDADSRKLARVERRGDFDSGKTVHLNDSIEKLLAKRVCFSGKLVTIVNEAY